jgi:hypothetical protein
MSSNQTQAVRELMKNVAVGDEADEEELVLNPRTLRVEVVRRDQRPSADMGSIMEIAKDVFFAAKPTGGAPDPNASGEPRVFVRKEDLLQLLADLELHGRTHCMKSLIVSEFDDGDVFHVIPGAADKPEIGGGRPGAMVALHLPDGSDLQQLSTPDLLLLLGNTADHRASGAWFIAHRRRLRLQR